MELLIWGIVIIGILLVIIPFLLGLLVSPHQRATRVELIKAPTIDVWNALSDLSRQTEWRTDLKSVQFKDDDDGMRWVELTKKGEQLVTRKKKEVNQKEILIQIEKGSRVRGTRQAILSSVPGGTRVTFTETSDIRSPFSRIIAQVGSTLDKRLNSYIAQLKNRFKQ
ncbi:MAG: hypothetical protein CR991_07690 [Proteobacteria bacterium]|nr:MAG: hypothetical protein CR991_07690 [Pseudomonadota bacterium]